MLALFSYNRAANRCRNLNTGIGLIVAILSAAVGTSVFASLGQSVSGLIKVIVGAVSLLAAVMSGIQVFAALPQRIEEYEKSARRFGVIRRQIEQTRLSLETVNAIELKAEMDRIRTSLDSAAEASPNAPRKIWEKTRRHVKGEYTWREVGLRRVRGLPTPVALGVSTSHQSRTP